MNSSINLACFLVGLCCFHQVASLALEYVQYYPVYYPTSSLFSYNPYKSQSKLGEANSTYCTLDVDSLYCTGPKGLIGCKVKTNLAGVDTVRFELFGLSLVNNTLAENVTFNLYPQEVLTQKWFSPKNITEQGVSIGYSSTVGLVSGLVVDDLECWEALVEAARLSLPVMVPVETFENKTESVSMFGTVFFMNEHNTYHSQNLLSKYQNALSNFKINNFLRYYY